MTLFLLLILFRLVLNAGLVNAKDNFACSKYTCETLDSNVRQLKIVVVFLSFQTVQSCIMWVFLFVPTIPFEMYKASGSDGKKI